MMHEQSLMDLMFLMIGANLDDDDAMSGGRPVFGA
jgi:hypothetical protein